MDELEEISRGLVELHGRYYGTTPDDAKAYAVDDSVICVLNGGFGKVERALIDEGKTEGVRELRNDFQQAKQDEFSQVVEQATGRKVIGYVSQVHVNPDLAVEMFFLEPLN